LIDLPDHHSVSISANPYTTPAFGFDRYFDTLVSVKPERPHPEGIDPQSFAVESDESGFPVYLRFLREAISHEHLIASLKNGVRGIIEKVSHELPLPKLFDDGAQVIRDTAVNHVKQCDRPLFLFTNFMDAHEPYCQLYKYDTDVHRAPFSWTSKSFMERDLNVSGAVGEDQELLDHYRGIYNASVEYLDRVVSGFVDDVQRATDNETTFIITADHGQGLGYDSDDGILAHMNSLSEGLLHVPLEIINPPDDCSQTIERLFSHLQLGAIIKNSAKGESIEVHDHDVLAERVGGGPNVHTIPLSDTDFEFWDRMQRCVYDTDSKVVYDSLGESKQYRIFEQRPCYQEETDLSMDIQSLDSTLFDTPIAEYKQKAKDQNSDTDEVDAATRSRLSDLGYM